MNGGSPKIRMATYTGYEECDHHIDELLTSIQVDAIAREGRIWREQQTWSDDPTWADDPDFDE